MYLCQIGNISLSYWLNGDTTLVILGNCMRMQLLHQTFRSRNIRGLHHAPNDFHSYENVYFRPLRQFLMVYVSYLSTK
jgi:hypothetical protein